MDSLKKEFENDKYIAGTIRYKNGIWCINKKTGSRIDVVLVGIGETFITYMKPNRRTLSEIKWVDIYPDYTLRVRFMRDGVIFDSKFKKKKTDVFLQVYEDVNRKDINVFYPFGDIVKENLVNFISDSTQKPVDKYTHRDFNGTDSLYIMFK